MIVDHRDSDQIPVRDLVQCRDGGTLLLGRGLRQECPLDSLTNLDWLTSEVQKVGDWIEQQAAIAASKNVVPLHAAG